MLMLGIVTDLILVTSSIESSWHEFKISQSNLADSLSVDTGASHK